uniref:Response regulatory domain-containing protein n=1 Tax=Arcella intermedia TaxID=1963864 RepID=A0A6B2LYJ1_9EUKA
MDVMIPVMDGCKATKEIRKLDGYATVPIIGVTASATIEMCLDSGMDQVLLKPLSPEELKNIIHVKLV